MGKEVEVDGGGMGVVTDAWRKGLLRQGVVDPVAISSCREELNDIQEEEEMGRKKKESRVLQVEDGLPSSA